MKRHRSLWLTAIPPLVVLVISIIVMDLIARAIGKPFLLPTPASVLHMLVAHRSDLFASLLTTAEGAIVGFLASAIFGIIAAMILSTSGIIRRAFYPYTVFFQTVPIVAIAPLLVIWCGPGVASVALCAFIVSVFPVIANTLAGLLSTDPSLEDLFRLYGANPWDRLWKLKLPAALPNIFTGLRVAAGFAVIGTVVAEFLVGLFGPGEGLGVRIVSAKKVGHTDEMFAAILIASLLGLAMFAGINLAARVLLRNWHASERE